MVILQGIEKMHKVIKAHKCRIISIWILMSQLTCRHHREITTINIIIMLAIAFYLLIDNKSAEYRFLRARNLKWEVDLLEIMPYNGVRDTMKMVEIMAVMLKGKILTQIKLLLKLISSNAKR